MVYFTNISFPTASALPGKTLVRQKAGLTSCHLV